MVIYKKLFSILLLIVIFFIGNFLGYHIAHAYTGGGTATIAVDGGATSTGVTVVKSTSHIFTTILTIDTAGMTLGAASPTFTIPTGFTVPNNHAVATAGDVKTDGEWSVVASGGGCTVDSSPVSSTTVASGQIITVDITADCAVGNTITLTYQGTSNVTMGATQLVVSTTNAGDTTTPTPLTAGSPTITVTSAPATITSAMVTGPNQVTIVFDHPVDWNMNMSEFTNLNIGGVKTGLSASGSPSSTIVIAFSGGGAVGTDATGTIDIAAMSDHGSGYTFAGVNGLALLDRQTPTYTAVVTSPTSITLTFSENVTTLGGDTDGDGWAISGTDANGVLVTGNTNPGGYGNTMVLTLSGGTLSGGTHPVVNVNYTQASGTTVDLNSNQVANNSSVAASESIKPTVTITASQPHITAIDNGNTFDVILTFSEPMDSGVYPTISFSENVINSGLLTFVPPSLGSWSGLGNTIFTQEYTINGTISEDFAGVDITAEGGTDYPAGNVMDTLNTVNVFDVNTLTGFTPSIPVANPAAGAYTGTQNITLTSANSTSIHYTIDGSTPDCLSGLTANPVSVSSSETINAKGCDDAGNISDLGTFIYTINKTSSSVNGSGPLVLSSGGNTLTLPLSLTPLVTTPLAVIPGCGNRTTGFSTITGQSCVTNISHNEQISSVGLFNFTLLLKMGSGGNEVTELQKFLNGNQYNNGLVVDGKFGLKTKMAVIKFQLANGLKEDGIVGLLTRAKIK